ncbi:MAG: hypothetical protein ACR2HM_05015 [Acidimicrobiales bacterium]
MARQLGDAHREAIGASIPPVYRPDRDRLMAELSAGLAPKVLAMAWSAGREMSPDDALDLALAGPPAEPRS